MSKGCFKLLKFFHMSLKPINPSATIFSFIRTSASKKERKTANAGGYRLEEKLKIEGF
jgi:hypothetical protein